MKRDQISIAVVGALFAATASVSAVQHEDPQVPASPAAQSADVTACRTASQQAVLTIGGLDARLETARQTNNPSQLRAAMDDLQTALGSLRAQLASCATLAADQGGAIGNMPGMRHSMPGTGRPVSGTSPALAPGATPGELPGQIDHSSHSQAAVGIPAPPAQSQTNRNAVVTSPGVEITFKGQPAPLKTGDNRFEVAVESADGKPITDADVSVLFVMPAMPAMKMPEMRNEVKLKSAGDGRYTGTGRLMMAGQWNVTVSVKQKGKEIGQKKINVRAQ